jgi:HPt (histidine-containing phosphotransfer) domain-containing protein
MNRTPLLAPAGDFDTRGAGPATVRGDLPAELIEVLDAQALQRLRELDPASKSGLVLRVMRTFDSSMQRLLQQFQQGREANDLDALRHVAHTLKSSAASVGALQLSQICADIERMVREHKTDGLHERLDDMVSECNRLLALLKLMAPNPG